MANPSLQIGNDNWAIKEDNLLGYSSSGTRFFPQPITMTRASAGTRVNSSGLVETVELLGGELVTNGDFATDSDWIKQSNWTISGGLANSDGTSGYIKQNSVVTNNKVYKISFTAIVTSGQFRVVTTADASTYTPYITSSGSYIFYINPTVSIAGGVEFISDSFAGSIDNVSVKESTKNNLARVDYTDGTSSLLVEPQRTNLVTYSEDTTQWTDVGITYSVDSIISPDGTLNGSKAIIDDTITTSNTRPMASFSVTSGLDYVFYVFAKADEFDIINLDFTNAAFSTASATYNLTSGTVTSFSGLNVSQGVEDYGNGWYKCYVVATAIATGTSALIIRLDDNPTGDGTKGLYLWGAQAEVGSYATSYIPTDGSTVTRVQDQYTKTGISDKINSEEGVLFLEVAYLTQTSPTIKEISLNDGTNSNRVALRLNTTTNQIRAIVRVGGSNQFTVQNTISNVTNYNKIALKYKENDFALWLNGVELDTDTSGSIPSGLNQLDFDEGNGASVFCGKVKQLQVFKTALTDPELATLTTI